VIVLPDAYSLQNDLHDSHEEHLYAAQEALNAAGYHWFEAEYNDAEPWHHDWHIVMLSRLILTTCQSWLIYAYDFARFKMIQCIFSKGGAMELCDSVAADSKSAADLAVATLSHGDLPAVFLWFQT
jgi:hypothetical protein